MVPCGAWARRRVDLLFEPSLELIGWRLAHVEGSGLQVEPWVNCGRGRGPRNGCQRPSPRSGMRGATEARVAADAQGSTRPRRIA